LSTVLRFKSVKNTLSSLRAVEVNCIKHRAARWYIFETQSHNLGKFWSVLQLIMLVNLMPIWYMLWSFGIFCGHLVYFVVIWYILWSFVAFCGHLVYFVVIMVHI
jgi:hypothetical protein